MYFHSSNYGTTEINNGFVQFIAELTKLSNNIKCIIVYISLNCKQIKLFKEIGDGEAMDLVITNNIIYYILKLILKQFKLNVRTMK